MIPELFQHLLRDTGAVIADGDHQLSVLCGGRHLHVQRVFILPGPVQDGIFHQRLKGKGRYHSLAAVHLHPEVMTDTAAKTHLLYVHIILHHLKLLVQRHNLL